MSDVISVLSALLPQVDPPAVYHVAFNVPPRTGMAKGKWRQRECSSLTDVVGAVEEAAGNAETYVALAAFAQGEGRRKRAVLGKNWISVDVDDKAVPDEANNGRHETARRVANLVPVPKVVIDSGRGFHVHVRLPDGERVQDFTDRDKGIAHVERLARALRRFLETEATDRFGAELSLDHAHGAERVWRVPNSFNCKAGDGRVLTADRARWRPVTLVNQVEELADTPTADVSFLVPFVRSRSVAGVGEPGDFDLGLLRPDLRGRWPLLTGDQSENDFCVAAALRDDGHPPAVARAAIAARRARLTDPGDRKKGVREDYLVRTIDSVYSPLSSAVAPASSEDLLRESGVRGLAEGACVDSVKGALERLALGLAGTDELTRIAVREAAVAQLKQIGVSSPAAFVDAALRSIDKAVVDSLQGQALVCDDVEPWPETVSGAHLLESLVQLLESYVVLPPGASTFLALWIVHTHAVEAAEATPYVALTSPVKRCGKTLVLTILGFLVRRPLPTTNVSAACVFRIVEAKAPTLLIDEADTVLSHNEDLRCILNSGYIPGGYVLRTVGDDHEPRRFSTWGPKAIGKIGKLPGTLEDRSVEIRMRRRKAKERVKRARRRALEAACRPLARQAARWARDNVPTLTDARPDLPETLNDRAADIWEPLFAIADTAGNGWSERARGASATLSCEGEEREAAVLLLSDIRDLFAERGSDRVASADLVEHLAEVQNRPWPEWKRGKPITQRQVARLLSDFGVAPKTIRIGDTTKKGYTAKDLEDAFTRYLTEKDPSQGNEDTEASDSEGVTTPSDGATIRNLCDRVTDPQNDASHIEESGCDRSFRCDGGGSEDEDAYAFEERAAIIEFDGGLDRETAEALAAQEVGCR